MMGDEETAGLVRRLPEELAPTSTALTFDEVRALLAARIAVLLDRQPALLMSVLYRIDVREPDVMRALEAPPGQVAAALADAVLARELEKAATRRAYGGGR